MMTTRDSSAGASAIQHEIGTTGRLTVRVADWDIELTGVDGGEVRVRDSEGRSLPDEFEVERGADSLSIRQVARFGLGFTPGHRRQHGTVRIELPAAASASIQTASGDIRATALGGQQQFRTASGDVQVRRSTGTLTTETVSGDVSVTVDGSLELTIKTVSGEVAVDDGRLDHLGITTTSGDIGLRSELGAGPHAIETLSGNALIASGRGVRISARTVAGDLSSDLPHTSEGGPGRRSVVIGDGATELRFKSVSGGLRVLDPARAESGPGPVTDVDQAASEASEQSRLEILRALERGEIDVVEATGRLARLDEPSNG
jgi:hypothetical protein